jgi:membrane associated rhomboid family serine protease
MAGSGMTKAVKVLLIAQVCVFILVQLAGSFMIPLFALVPSLAVGRLMVWQVLTYMFVHVGLWQLVLNLLMLWFFGVPLESAWGARRFLSFYFFTGVGAGICSLLAAMFAPGIVTGAAGVIFGLLVAQAILNPEGIILFLFLFPMKMRHAVWVFAAITVLGMISLPGSSAAAMAQLGGGLFGYLYFRSARIRLVLDSAHPSVLVEKWRMKNEKRRAEDQLKLDDEVDRILDKISRQGIHTLTAAERKMLERKSRKS